MGMTIVEKIIAAHATGAEIQPGGFVYAKIDIALANDVTAPLAIKEFRKAGIKRVFDPRRIALVPDHFTPNKDIKSAELAKTIRDFAREHGIEHYFEVGRGGIEHALLPEQGITIPGDLVVGADSHTCTYGALGAFATGMGSTDLAAAMALGEVWLRIPESIKFVYEGALGEWVSAKDVILYTIGQIGVSGALYRAMEFTGPVIDVMEMDGRLTLCNMAIEAGAKAGIVAPDEITRQYVEGRAMRPYTFYASDSDAVYSAEHRYDLSDMQPQVAAPHLPENADDVSKYADVKIDQVVIGSCTNGRISDLRVAAGVLKGKKIADSVRLVVFPATQKIYLQAMEEGLIRTFIEAGGAVSTPTCGPCLGGHMGVLAAGERAIATTNRNFVGRMGDPASEVYLSNPAVAAASAITGRITHPAEVM